MAIDAAVNFAKANLSAGYAAGVVTIVLETGGGLRFPTPPFNATWFNSSNYADAADDPNVEIVRVTNIVDDTLTITRAQESTSDRDHNAAGQTHTLSAGPTAKLVTDVAGITDDVATNATMYPTWVTAATGNLPKYVSSTKLTLNPSTGVLAATTFSGAGTNLTGTASSLTVGAATNAVNIGVTADEATAATMYPAWVTATSGNLPAKVSSTLTWNPSTDTLSAGVFSGAGTNLTGTAASLTAGTATNAVNVGITDDATTNAAMYPLWATTSTGNLPCKTTASKLSFNPSTGALSATSFLGAAAAGTLSGTTMATNVVTSSLTTVGATLAVATSVTTQKFIPTGSQSTFDTSSTSPVIYSPGGGGQQYPFAGFGHLVLQARPSGANRDIVLVTGTTQLPRMSVNEVGVGIGTRAASPLATLEVADASTLAAESLTNGALTSGTSWTQTGDMALAADAATYTHSSGVGTLNQASGTLAIAGVGTKLYAFVYTISAVSGTAPVATITTAFALTAQTLVTGTAGTYTLVFRSAVAPGNFVISVTSGAAGAFTIDTLSLKEVTGGRVLAHAGLSSGTGSLGLLHAATNTTATGLAYFGQASADADSFDLVYRKSRGTTVTPTVITTADELGTIQFSGYSGAGGYVVGAAIKAISEATIATTRVPANLSFWTGTDAAPTVLTQRMVISSAGVVTLSTAPPAFAAGDKYLVIDATGNIHVSALGPLS